MKNRSKLYDDLPLGKPFSIFDMIIVAVFVYETNSKYYPHIF